MKKLLFYASLGVMLGLLYDARHTTYTSLFSNGAGASAIFGLVIAAIVFAFVVPTLHEASNRLCQEGLRLAIVATVGGVLIPFLWAVKDNDLGVFFGLTLAFNISFFGLLFILSVLRILWMMIKWPNKKKILGR